MIEFNHKISIIIPFYEKLGWLIEAVESVLHQTYKNIEIIVINDGSPENIDSFLNIYANSIIYILKDNGGPASARNKGIEIATGEYIAFLDSDDLWEPNKLEIQYKYMLDNNLVWSHTSYSVFNDKEYKIIKNINVLNFHGDVFMNCLISSPIATPCVMVKRDFLIENSEIRFSEKMRYGQDGFMWLNIARYQHLGAIPDVLSKVRIRGKNAALRARTYLYAKSNLWEFIHQKALKDEKYKSIPKVIFFAYWLCYIGEKFISFLEKKKLLNVKSSEILSRFIYFPTYFILKMINLKD